MTLDLTCQHKQTREQLNPRPIMFETVLPIPGTIPNPSKATHSTRIEDENRTTSQINHKLRISGEMELWQRSYVVHVTPDTGPDRNLNQDREVCHSQFRWWCKHPIQTELTIPNVAHTPTLIHTNYWAIHFIIWIKDSLDIGKTVQYSTEEH